jgi:hypothetical protein
VDVDYYAAMGGKAYSALAGLFSGRSGGRSFARLYDELSSNYFGLIDVLNVISERTTTAESVRDAVGLIRLYERWERTKSERLQRALQERGVFPVYGTDYQMH